LEEGPRNIAVLDFRTIGQNVDPAAGEALASVIRSALVRGANVRVIEREALAAILKEQDLQMTDMVDPATAVEVGRIAGVDLLVMGSIAGVGSTYTVTSRIVDVTTGEAAEAEEFEAGTLDTYAKLGRLLAALIGEQPVSQDSIAAEPAFTENFEGDICRLHLGPLKDPRNETVLEKGRYVIRKATKGDHYWWIPDVKGDFYVQVDVGQIEGPPGAACGLVWSMKGDNDYLSVMVAANGRAWIERAQGKTLDVLSDRRDWAAVNTPPKSNRIRVETWGGRHRVFINGQCLDDFYEPDCREGKVGLRATLRKDDQPARFAADNLAAGAVQPGLAGLGPEEPVVASGEPKNHRRKVRTRAGAPTVRIDRTWAQFDTRRNADGVAIHTVFDTTNLRGRMARAVVTFKDSSTGKFLRARQGRFCGVDGKAVVYRDFRARSSASRYGDFDLFIPAEEFSEARPGPGLQCQVTILDQSTDPPVTLASSDWIPVGKPR